MQQLLASSSLRAGDEATYKVPRRTRYNIIERMNSRRILKTREIPDPAILGRPLVAFALGEAHADRVEKITEKWCEDRSAVLLWIAHERLFGVNFCTSQADVEALQSRLTGDHGLREVNILVADSRQESVPVFFDFEGAWSSFSHRNRYIHYPHGLPLTTAVGGGTPDHLSPADATAVSKILLGAAPDSMRSGAASARGGFMSRRRETRLHADGVVESRTLLDPAACARWTDDFYRSIVLVRGSLLTSPGAAPLFRDLVNVAEVAPFLYATDGPSVLFGYLSGRKNAEVPVANQSAPRLPSIVRTYLRDVSVARYDVIELQSPIDHRYERPFTGVHATEEVEAMAPPH